MLLISIIIILLLILLYTIKYPLSPSLYDWLNISENFKILITQAPRGIDAMHGRRTLVADIFPDKVRPIDNVIDDGIATGAILEHTGIEHTIAPYENFQEHMTMMPSGFLDQAPDKVLGQYMAGEAFHEDFTNTRQCMGAAVMDKQKGFALPTRWEESVCESHCPDYNMVGTRADNAGNLSVCARDALYDHVSWNVKEEDNYTAEKEYISMQNYVFMDRDSA
jgi:hypothetical protein